MIFVSAFNSEHNFIHDEFEIIRKDMTLIKRVYGLGSQDVMPIHSSR